MRSCGFIPGTWVLAAELMPAPKQIAQRLAAEPGPELAHISACTRPTVNRWPWKTPTLHDTHPGG